MKARWLKSLIWVGMLGLLAILPAMVMRGTTARDDAAGHNFVVVGIVAALAGMGIAYIGVMRVRRWRG